MRDVREYCCPETLEEALRLLSREGVRSAVVAGGTGLAAESPSGLESLIDLGRLPLAYIRDDRGALRLGALTRLQDLIDSPVLAGFASGVLADAVRATATPSLRHLATLSGTLLRGRRSELAPLLIVLQAEVELQRAESSTAIPLADLYEDLGGDIQGAILTEVFVPAPPPHARICRRHIARTPSDRPLLAVAALTLVGDGTVRQASIAAAGIGLPPRRLREVESGLSGRRFDAEDVEEAVSRAISHLDLPQDHCAGADYRRAALQVLIRRAVLGD